MFSLRDQNRYGKYKVKIKGIGECILSFDICGFGEIATITHKGEEIYCYDTTRPGNYIGDIEDENGLYLFVGYPYYKPCKVSWEELNKCRI